MRSYELENCKVHGLENEQKTLDNQKAEKSEKIEKHVKLKS